MTIKFCYRDGNETPFALMLRTLRCQSKIIDIWLDKYIILRDMTAESWASETIRNVRFYATGR
jgi:hypothetical protein